MSFGQIYAILGIKMAAIRPSWVGSGKGWCRKMRIRPEYDFASMTKWPYWIVFELRTYLCTFMQFRELKWPPFGRLRYDLEKVGGVRCVFAQSMILAASSNVQTAVFLRFGQIYAKLRNYGN